MQMLLVELLLMIRCADTGTVPDYEQTMSDEVSSLEAVRARVEQTAQSTVEILQTVNSTVVDIETRSADALSTSQQALQVNIHSALRHRHA